MLSIESHRKVMQYVRDNFTFRNLGIYICLSCGLRIGEVCAHTWSDIDIDEGVIRIRKTIERVYVMDEDERHTELMIEPPVSTTERPSRFTDGTAATLKNALKPASRHRSTGRTAQDSRLCYGGRLSLKMSLNCGSLIRNSMLHSLSTTGPRSSMRSLRTSI